MPGFVGSDTFTYAAWDGSKNSTLATGTVSVVQGPYSLGIVSHVATNAPAGWPVAFAVVPTVTNNSSAVTFNWNFGDGSAASTNQFAQHTFALPGIYSWQVVATLAAPAPATLAAFHQRAGCLGNGALQNSSLSLVLAIGCCRMSWSNNPPRWVQVHNGRS